jgi:hypothetical protein
MEAFSHMDRLLAVRISENRAPLERLEGRPAPRWPL